MPDSKISDLIEGTVVDKDNDFLVFVDSSDTTQNPLTGSTKKLKPANMPISTAIQTALNGKENTLNADQKRKITISTSAPTGGADGDVWFQYTP